MDGAFFIPGGIWAFLCLFLRKEVSAVVNRFYHLEQFNLNEIDKYIWQLGKTYFPKDFSKKK